MIEWNKARDKLPPYDTPVLVAGSETDGTYPVEYIYLMKMFVEHHTYMWQCIYDDDVFEVYENDKWAYINLPEQDGDTD